MQITHITDQETGKIVQIVSPEQLRKVLKKSGETLDRPKDFGPEDEWYVSTT
jgi:hypothetical protein